MLLERDALLLEWCALLLEWCALLLEWCALLLEWCALLLEWCALLLEWCALLLEWCALLLERRALLLGGRLCVTRRRAPLRGCLHGGLVRWRGMRCCCRGFRGGGIAPLVGGGLWWGNRRLTARELGRLDRVYVARAIGVLLWAACGVGSIRS